MTLSELKKEKEIRHQQRKEIISLLKKQLDRNKTRTMTFTEDGLELAIKMIEELNDNN